MSASISRKLTREQFYRAFLSQSNMTGDKFSLRKYSILECECNAENCCGWVAKQGNRVYPMTRTGTLRPSITHSQGVPIDGDICHKIVLTIDRRIEALDKMEMAQLQTENEKWDKRMAELEAIEVKSKPLGAWEALYSHLGSDKTRALKQNQSSEIVMRMLK